ncbi:MAG: transcriptional regulator [Flavobacteriaceae bacterium]|nr:MAG: transcriptional regulator [Flavobacteriaceae bacterium]
MLKLISISEHSKVPKYKQIINSIFSAIENGDINLNDKLPSVNELLIEFDISRDTIVRAYDHLKEKNVIDSVPGKGYYIINDKLTLKAKVFLLFNKLSTHKKIIFDAFSKTLGDHATIDFFIYDNNYRHFKELILASKSRDYTHYVIITHFEEGGDDAVNFIKKEIPLKKLVVLDKKIDALGSKIPCVYQDFENNIYSALIKLNPLLEKYKQINLIFRKKGYQPQEIIKGFQHFCGEFAYDFKVIDHLNNIEIEKNTAYINLMESDLVTLIKKIKQTDYVLGKDVGIISYNDTPLKEILLDGITVISTDFEKLGEQAANMILNNQKSQFNNPFYIIHRKSL